VNTIITKNDEGEGVTTIEMLSPGTSVHGEESEGERRGGEEGIASSSFIV
jgi:hypothetical protein